MDVASLAQLLHETSDHHGLFEKVARPTTGGIGMPRTRPRARPAVRPRKRRTPPGCTWSRWASWRRA